jgi:cytochrome b subunit of formate dehydrogenase
MYNAGQKVQFWEIVVGSAVYLITGVVMWAGARTFDAMLVAISYILHDISRSSCCSGSSSTSTCHYRAMDGAGNDSRHGHSVMGLDPRSWLVPPSYWTRSAAGARAGTPAA